MKVLVFLSAFLIVESTIDAAIIGGFDPVCSVSRWSGWSDRTSFVGCDTVERTRSITDSRPHCLKPALKETKQDCSQPSAAVGAKILKNTLGEKLFCAPTGVDFMIILDGSGSIPVSDFEYGRKLSKAFAGDVSSQGLGEATHKNRFAFMVFSNGNQIHLHLDFMNYNIQDILNAIDNANRPGSLTYTTKALQRTIQLWIDNGRPGVKRQLLLFSDGRSNDASPAPEPKVPAATLKNSLNVEIFGFGLGNVYMPELESIVSKPIKDHIFTAKNYRAANDIVQLALKGAKVCPV